MEFLGIQGKAAPGSNQILAFKKFKKNPGKQKKKNPSGNLRGDFGLFPGFLREKNLLNFPVKDGEGRGKTGNWGCNTGKGGIQGSGMIPERPSNHKAAFSQEK